MRQRPPGNPVRAAFRSLSAVRSVFRWAFPSAWRSAAPSAFRQDQSSARETYPLAVPVGRLLRAGLGSGCVRGVRHGRVARGSRRTRLRCVSCGRGAVGGIRCAGIGRILRRGRLRRGILLLRVQAGRQHHAAGKQAQGNRQPDRAGHIPPCCIQVFSHVFLPFELFRHPSPPGHCRDSPLSAPIIPVYPFNVNRFAHFCAICSFSLRAAVYSGEEREERERRERRWGLLERSPQTPKNFSRLWIDRRRS